MAFICRLPFSYVHPGFQQPINKRKKKENIQVLITTTIFQENKKLVKKI